MSMGNSEGDFIQRNREIRLQGGTAVSQFCIVAQLYVVLFLLLEF